MKRVLHACFSFKVNSADSVFIEQMEQCDVGRIYEKIETIYCTFLRNNNYKTLYVFLPTYLKDHDTDW